MLFPSPFKLPIQRTRTHQSSHTLTLVVPFHTARMFIPAATLAHLLSNFISHHLNVSRISSSDIPAPSARILNAPPSLHTHCRPFFLSISIHILGVHPTLSGFDPIRMDDGRRICLVHYFSRSSWAALGSFTFTFTRRSES